MNTENPVNQKDAAAVRFFPPGIPLIAILLGIGLNWLWPIDFGLAIPLALRYLVGGLIIVISVLGLGLRAVRLFRRRGQNENPWKPTPHIEESGPFELTRNPMYLQMVLSCIGIAVVLMNWWILFLTPMVGWLLQELAIKPEEAYLERKFGAAYLEYKSRVRRWV